jgi:arylsulfatase
LVNNTELYDLQTDPGENKNIISEHPEVVANLRSAYDKWWEETLPLLVNENAIGPKINPMKELYWKQFGGEPDAKLLERMNPNQENSKKAERKTPKKKPADQDSPPKY